jgi:hypothetical protein
MRENSFCLKTVEKRNFSFIQDKNRCQCSKTIFLRHRSTVQYARAFVPDKPSQPSLLFEVSPESCSDLKGCGIKTSIRGPNTHFYQLFQHLKE